MSRHGEHNVLATVLRYSRQLVPLALGAALLLTLAYQLTHEHIATQRLAAQRQALAAVLPELAHDNDLLAAGFTIDPGGREFVQTGLLGLSRAATGYRASLGGQPSGVILPMETSGFNGRITLMIGITADGNITGVRVVDHRETRGLGDRIETDNSRWILAFDNRSLANTPPVLWQVKKDGGDFDQFVGATITPRAVVRTIHGALLFFEANQQRLLE